MTDILDITTLLQRSDAFFANVIPPTTNNLVKNIIDRSSVPTETSDKIVHHANKTHILLHSQLLPLLDGFLSLKRIYGSDKEQLLYKEMTPAELVRRLIKNRSLSFYNHYDRTKLRDNSKPPGDHWQRVGTGKEGLIKLEDYLSYDEIQIGALLGVSSPTFFINSGGRYNCAELGESGTFETEGVYVGLVGARFEKDKMEAQHIIVSKRYSRPEFGFGVEGARQNPIAAEQMQPFAALYSQPYSSAPRHFFPSYDEAQADTSGNFYRTLSGSFLNIAAYKARLQIPIECLLVDADARAHESGTKAYVFLVGLGLGVWRKCDKQPQWLVEVVADVLQSVVLPNVADVDFNWFPENVNTCGGATSGQSMTGAGGNQIDIHFTTRSPADRLPPSDPPKLLVASYAWDGNAFPGNEYWMGLLSSSGDPAAACCSTIPELQNAWINTGFLDRQHIVKPVCKKSTIAQQ